MTEMFLSQMLFLMKRGLEAPWFVPKDNFCIEFLKEFLLLNNSPLAFMQMMFCFYSYGWNNSADFPAQERKIHIHQYQYFKSAEF